MDYRIIDAHAHLWLRQETVVNGLPVTPLPNGRVVCIGYSKNDVTFHTGLFVKKEMDIRGSRNAMPSDFEAVIRYLRRGGCPVEKFITRVVTPAQAGDALREWPLHPGKMLRILAKL